MRGVVVVVEELLLRMLCCDGFGGCYCAYLETAVAFVGRLTAGRCDVQMVGALVEWLNDELDPGGGTFGSLPAGLWYVVMVCWSPRTVRAMLQNAESVSRPRQ